MLDSKKVATINKVLAKGKLVALGALVGILLGVGGTIFFQNCNPPDEDKGAAATAVLGRFVEQTELRGDIPGLLHSRQVSRRGDFFRPFRPSLDG